MLEDTAHHEFRVHSGTLYRLGDAIDPVWKGADAPDGDEGKEESMNAKSGSAFRPCFIVSIVLALAVCSSSPPAAQGNSANSPSLAPAALCRYGALQPVVAYPTLGTFPQSVVMGRFNADTFFDLAVTNSGQLNAGEVVSVLLNNGDGTFAGAVPYVAGQSPHGLATDDFNGDGLADLVVTNYNSGDYAHPGNISVLLGNGDGTFQAAVNFDVGYGPTSVATGDFNNDTRRDVAVTNWGNSNSVSVLLGNGDGTLQPAVHYAAGNGPYGVATGDFNRDSITDLAVANFRYSDVESTVSILLGTGGGAFQAATNFRVGQQPSSVVVGLFDAGSDPDLAVTDFDGAFVSILTGNGDGSFASFGNITAGPRTAVATADFDADTRADLVLSTGALVGIALGKGDASFQPVYYYDVVGEGRGIAAGDLNGDAQPDVAVALIGSETAGVLLNDCWKHNYLPGIVID
jgi:hypothetical protein